MQNYKALRTISLIFFFVTVTFGCTTSNGSYAARKNQVGNSEFKLTTKAVPEGIQINLINLPSDITHLWLHVTSWEDTEYLNPENAHYYYASVTDENVHGWTNSTNQLDKIKQTGSIIFPFIEARLNYLVSVSVYNEQEFNSMIGIVNENIEHRKAFTQINIINNVNNGIYFNRDDVKLELNAAHSAVTLITEPIFSADVIFDEQKYSFDVRISIDGNKSIGIGDHHFPVGLSADGLSWAFEPYFNNILKVDAPGHDWLTDPSYPARASVYANIIYDDISWRVELANSSEFNYSL